MIVIKCGTILLEEMLISQLIWWPNFIQYKQPIQHFVVVVVLPLFFYLSLENDSKSKSKRNEQQKTPPPTTATMTTTKNTDTNKNTINNSTKRKTTKMFEAASVFVVVGSGGEQINYDGQNQIER